MTTRALLTSLFAIVATTPPSLQAQQPRDENGASTPARPVIAPMFTPLPLGQVEPQGRFRDWAGAAKDGITALDGLIRIWGETLRFVKDHDLLLVESCRTAVPASLDGRDLTHTREQNYLRPMKATD